jgi:hypothetical protein
MVPLCAICLLLEHYTFGRWQLHRRWYYAAGLVTVLILFLGWAVVCRLVSLPLALGIMIAAVLSGVPDWIVLAREEAEDKRRWASLVRRNRDQAAQLALLRQLDGRQWRRVRDLAETATFALGTAQEEIEGLQLFLDQAGPLLRPLVDAMKGAGDGAERS